MLPKRDGIPGAAVLDPRYSVQLAPCTVCGATLDTYVTDCTYPVSGVTVLRCPRCRTVETEAMRAAQRLSRVVPERARVCANPACDTTIPESRRYCSRDCHTAHQVAERAARVARLAPDAATRAEKARQKQQRRRANGRARQRGVLGAWRARQRVKQQEVAA